MSSKPSDRRSAHSTDSAAKADAAANGQPTHVGEPHTTGLASRMNWLRAGVLGANDGIVSVAGLVVGVAGATNERLPIFTAGVAGLVAGAISMALGEYVSVSSQRDSESAQLDKEKRELAETPDEELEELAAIYQAKGLSEATAYQVAVELTERDALAAHAEVELHLDPANIANPWQAAFASAVSFTVGALLPLLAILAPPMQWRVPTTVVAVLLALAVTGLVSARIGHATAGRAVVRVVVGGGLGLAAAYGIGHLFGATVG